MKLVGDGLFARDADGKLKSRIGTLFLRTPGLVTQRGIHAMQRLAWIAALNAERAAAGAEKLSAKEEAAELAESVDLLFTDEFVLIRPDPARMDLALRADEVLQTMVSKLKIRYLNTHTAKVRDALRARGENWRMARRAASPEEINRAIENARTAILCEPVYYYSSRTGTRYLTAGGCARVCKLEGAAFRAQVAEIVRGLTSRNRLGQLEVALFPATLPPPVPEAFRAVDPAADDAALRRAVEAVLTQWRLALPANLREETTENLDWRNEMYATLGRGPNETTVGDNELVSGISAEFFRQIEWLPGARVEKGELIFDPLYDEARRTQDPALLDLCEAGVRGMIFNLMRLYTTVDWVNIGRITRSLARRPVAGHRRGSVYIIQYHEKGAAAPGTVIVRFQKWDTAEHLDQGHDLLRAMVEANDYADYILDRRLACRQLGMNLPYRISLGTLLETYRGTNAQYKGTLVRANYYVRAYIPGVASDKIPPERFRNPAFAQAFATLMGQAAALDMIVGRAATETGEPVFDTNFETVQFGPDGLPKAVAVTDHAGSFVKYLETFDELVAPYANAVRRRLKFVTKPEAFTEAYVAGFQRKLAETQAAYRARRNVFDHLFDARPYDEAGSCAFRWSRVLKRLDACDPAAVAERLRAAARA